MSLRSAGLVGIAYLMVLGCATPVVETTKTPESEQRKRQEQWIRGDSSIGEVGPMGAPSTLGTPRGARFETIYIHETPVTPQEINPGEVRSSDVQLSS